MNEPVWLVWLIGAACIALPFWCLMKVASFGQKCDCPDGECKCFEDVEDYL